MANGAEGRSVEESAEVGYHLACASDGLVVTLNKPSCTTRLKDISAIDAGMLA